MTRNQVLRWAAPAVFLAALTVAVLLVRSGLHHHGGTTTTSTAATPTVTTIVSTSGKSATRTGTAKGAAGTYTVQSGDTYGSIAAKYGLTVSELEQLNPGVSSNSLSVGQKIRIK